MTDNSQYPFGLSIYDPRAGEVRYFDARRAGRLLNINLGIAIIETDHYRSFTDASVVAWLVNSLAGCYSSPHLILSILPAVELPSGPALELLNTFLVGDQVCSQYRIIPPFLDRVSLLFEGYADHEQWTFTAPRHDDASQGSIDERKLVDFDSCLHQSVNLEFAIAIDLDGMLIGFLQADDRFDRFLSLLRTLG